MGQFSSRISPPRDTGNIPGIDSDTTTPAPSSSPRLQSNLRRRRSSTNSANLPSSRRRRVPRFWRTSTEEQTSERVSSNSSLVDEATNEDPGVGSGNVTRTTPAEHISNRFIDELDNIASDLFAAVSSMDSVTRTPQQTNWSPLRRFTSADRHLQRHNRRFYHHHNNTSSETFSSSNAAFSFESQVQTLSRLLEAAATSTVYTLVGSRSPPGRRFDSTSRARGNSENDDTDTNFQQFITALRGGLLTRELSRNTHDGIPQNQQTFFRAFRFDDEERQDQNLMVPVMIVGVRSVQQDTEPDHYDHEVELTANALDSTSLQTPPPVERPRPSNSSSTSEDSSYTEEHGYTQQSPVMQRSWVIFVMGNTFTPNHPVLSAPSLMNEHLSYDDLINLQELIGQVKPPTVSKEELHKHNDQLFELRLGNEIKFAKTTQHETLTVSLLERCQICLGDYEQNEIVRKLPLCGHFYHKDCVDTWLLKGVNNCPLCRSKGISAEEKTNQEVEV